nr:hypothetical protein Iba_chr05cCG12990 [Ipomoea batatas]
MVRDHGWWRQRRCSPSGDFPLFSTSPVSGGIRRCSPCYAGASRGVASGLPRRRSLPRPTQEACNSGDSGGGGGSSLRRCLVVKMVSGGIGIVLLSRPNEAAMLERLTTSATTRICSKCLNLSLKENKCSWATLAFPRTEIKMVFESDCLVMTRCGKFLGKRYLSGGIFVLDVSIIRPPPIVEGHPLTIYDFIPNWHGQAIITMPLLLLISLPQLIFGMVDYDILV